MARELAPVLDYTQRRNFTKVLDKAMIGCTNSGNDVICDFAEVSKIVDADVTSNPAKDYEFSRYDCYLIVQNGDSHKEVIALEQTYHQEIADKFNQLACCSRRYQAMENSLCYTVTRKL